jgi:chromosome segregation ATPase
MAEKTEISADEAMQVMNECLNNTRPFVRLGEALQKMSEVVQIVRDAEGHVKTAEAEKSSLERQIEKLKQDVSAEAEKTQRLIENENAAQEAHIRAKSEMVERHEADLVNVLQTLKAKEETAVKTTQAAIAKAEQDVKAAQLRADGEKNRLMAEIQVMTKQRDELKIDIADLSQQFDAMEKLISRRVPR